MLNMIPGDPTSRKGAKLLLPNNRFPAFIVILWFICCASTALVGDAHAGCRWVWQGINSYWTCDEEEIPRIQGISICEFSSVRDSKGDPKSLTVFCRSDGSIWKEVVVGSMAVDVRKFSREGTLLGKKSFFTKIEQSAPRTEQRPSRTRRIDRPKQTKRIEPPQPPKPAPPPRKRPKPKPQWVKKNFETSVMGSRVRGTVERKGSDLRGVLYVYPLFGGKDTYHFHGSIQGNRVVASHTNGHVFRGTIVRGRKVKGVLTTSRGVRIPLDVPVAVP